MRFDGLGAEVCSAMGHGGAGHRRHRGRQQGAVDAERSTREHRYGSRRRGSPEAGHDAPSSDRFRRLRLSPRETTGDQSLAVFAAALIALRTRSKSRRVKLPSPLPPSFPAPPPLPSTPPFLSSPLLSSSLPFFCPLLRFLFPSLLTSLSSSTSLLPLFSPSTSSPPPPNRPPTPRPYDT